MATKTIGLTGFGRDFTSLAQYVSTYLTGLTFSTDEILEFYNDGGPIVDTTAVTISGYTANSGAKLIFRAATGHSFRDGAVTTNPLKYSSSQGVACSSTLAATGTGCYRFTGGSLLIEGLQFDITSNTSTGIQIGINTGTTFQNNIVQGVGGGFLYKVDSAPVLTYNNLFIQKGDSGGVKSEAGGSGGANQFIGNTIVRIGGSSTQSGFISSTAGAPVARNNVVFGFNSSFDGDAGAYHATSGNNATSASFVNTNTGTSGQTGVSSSDFVNTSSGTENLKVISTSTKLIDTGATVGLTTDIIKNARPQGAAYDIGAHEYTAPPPDSSLTASQGSYTVTGQAAGMVYTRIFTAAQGNYAMSGQSANLTYAQPGVYTLVSAYGTYSITGQDALSDYAMNAVQGSYSISGQDVTFIRTFPAQYSMPAVYGTYTLTGRRANLLAPGDVPSLGDGDKYVKLALMGYTGALNDMLVKYYKDNGATSSQINEAEMQFLLAQGATSFPLNNRRVEFYKTFGYTGSVTDMEYQYWWEL